jgi:hypothetical protein
VQVVLSNTHAFIAANTSIERVSVIFFVPKAKLLTKTHNFTDRQLPTPVKVDCLIIFLEGYDNLLTEFLAHGFSEGFPLHYQDGYKSFIAKNLVSALSNPLAVYAKILKELSACCLAGPFDKPPFQDFWVSALGVVPKKVPDEFRLIHHLSYPHGSTVNNGIHHEHSTVSYSTIDNAIKLIKQLGPGCLKTDIKNAFRLLPIQRKIILY